MTVKELIKKLNEMPQDLPVVVYSQLSEDGDIAFNVNIAISGTDSEPYYEGASPFDGTPGVKHVVIS